ncbi:MAG: molybdopterin-dependent oxidoreductase, partial [Bacteroidales bacterium]|nr:molybdopterin-dependent oxidoreductase [Bacteroidales bacterium]
GKTANGLIALKEKNNAHGIFDMGVCPSIGVGTEPILDKDRQYRMKFIWKTDQLPQSVNKPGKLLQEGKIKNALIFGEDPLGCAIDKESIKKQLESIDFTVVQDLWMSDTARLADLVLPASMPWEFGGSYTNSQRKIQQIKKQIEVDIEHDSFKQLATLLEKTGLSSPKNPGEALEEAISLFPRRGEYKNLRFNYMKADNPKHQFDFGCDLLHKTIDEEFAEKLGW